MELRGDIRGQELSQREWEVLRAVAQLGGQREAALELGIAEGTVKNHLTRIYRKLGVTTQAEALAAVGWLRLPDEAEAVVHDVAVALTRLRAEREQLREQAQDIADALA
jgi:DNA-binding CsgD family transcriptional regulator